MSEKPFVEAVRILAAMAWADGSMDPNEEKMLRSMIEVGPLDADEKAKARSWLGSRPNDTVDAVKKLALEARLDIYRSAVRVAAADGRTVRDERNFLTGLAERLDIPADRAKGVRDAERDAALAAAPAFNKLFRLPTHTLNGELTSLGDFRGKALLIVNVASECGLTPQYEQLQKLYEARKDRGFFVIGFPCNQFGAQEPGSPDEIAAFCTRNYGVTFPLMEKVDVNGDARHDIYELLTTIPDAEGNAGDIMWNFEKFVVSHDGNTITRFRPQTKPDDPAVLAAVKAALPPKLPSPSP